MARCLKRVTSIFGSHLEGAARVCPREKTGAKLAEIIAIIAPLVARKNPLKPLRVGPISPYCRVSHTNPAINRN